jgi:hypothetical protein
MQSPDPVSGRFRKGRVASRAESEARKDGLAGAFLATLVVLVLVAWTSVLVYLGISFL